ncbi:MAG: HAD-IC family P-type ATPase [Solobacterium sp.]|nr:HAD-IC family P-type ATPase [Solobacterium sp.]
MNHKGSPMKSIPSILSIPEKLNSFFQHVIKFRLPVERRFSVRDILLALGALLLTLLLRNISLPAAIQTVLSVFLLLFALIPVFLQAFRLIRKRRFPVEEATVFLSALIAFAVGEHTAAILIPALSVILWQVEGYSLLHVEAAPNAIPDAEETIRNHVMAADEEKSTERRTLAFASAAFYALLLLVGIIMMFLSLFHLQNAAEWIRRGLILLMLSLPSAILFSLMLTHFGAVFSSGKTGAVFRNDQVPEDFSHCRVFAFGKTGTVTDGRFQISEIVPVGVSEEDLLRIAAVAECKSDHPIALAIKSAAGLKEGAVPSGVMDVQEIPGKGVSTFFSGRQIYVGNASLLEDHNIWYQVPSKTGTAIHVAVDSTYRGYFLISDTLRENAFEALEELRAQGASCLAMLTGDVQSVSRAVAASLNFDMVKAHLTPAEKASAISYLRSSQSDRERIAAVGDGSHDEAMFEAADISVCMEQKPSGIADLSICSDDILTIPRVYRICRETERIMLASAVGVAGVKLMLCFLGLFHVIPISLVAVFDSVFGIVAVIYSLTCLTLENRGMHG